MKFKKQDLIDMVNDESDILLEIENEIVDTSRWSIHYRAIFKFEDRFYETRYSRGATEHQDERPYEYASDEIECPEVVPVEKTVIEYERIKA